MVTRHDQATDPEILQGLLDARRGTAFFARKLNELSDADLDGASLLPGWTRRHVVAHIGYNARAIARLVEWAATGVETPMYASTAIRNQEIDFGATLSPIALRNLFDHSAVHLSVEWRDLPDTAWKHQVRTIQGRQVPAYETIWMRSREVWVHAVDLDNGATFDQIPTNILERLLTDITTAWKNRGDDRNLLLKIIDAPTVSELGDLDSSDPNVITGTLPAVTAFACGRNNQNVTSSKHETAIAPRWI